MRVFLDGVVRLSERIALTKKSEINEAYSLEKQEFLAYKGGSKRFSHHTFALPEPYTFRGLNTAVGLNYERGLISIITISWLDGEMSKTIEEKDIFRMVSEKNMLSRLIQEEVGFPPTGKSDSYDYFDMPDYRIGTSVDERSFNVVVTAKFER